MPHSDQIRGELRAAAKTAWVTLLKRSPHCFESVTERKFQHLSLLAVTKSAGEEVPKDRRIIVLPWGLKEALSKEYEGSYPCPRDLQEFPNVGPHISETKRLRKRDRKP